MKSTDSPSLNRWRVRILVIVLSSVPMVHRTVAQVPADVISLKGNVSLHVVDKTGKSVSATAIPEDLRTRLQEIAFGEKGNESSGLVVAKVKLPDGEQDVHYGSSLVGRSWYGGMHYLNVGNGANPDVVCIRLGHKDGDCRFELKKLNYKPIVIPIPSIDPSGKIIWLGELSPERYGPNDPRQVVSGKVISTSGKPVPDGKVTIRVNGTPAKVSVPITGGAFAFRDITPGDYLVEFWMDGYSAQTWWLTLKDGEPDASKMITAYPIRTFSLRIHDGDKAKEISLTAGIPYRDATFPLPDGKGVRLNQEGESISIYCPDYFIQVPNKTRGSVYYSWRGDLSKGDSIQILKAETNDVVYTVDCLDVTSADPSSPPSALSATRPAVADSLSLMDPGKHSSSKSVWRRTADGIEWVSNDQSPTYAGTFQLPVSLSADYAVEVEFTCGAQNENIGITIPVGDRRMTTCWFFGYKGYVGIGKVDGKDPWETEALGVSSALQMELVVRQS